MFIEFEYTIIKGGIKYCCFSCKAIMNKKKTTNKINSSGHSNHGTHVNDLEASSKQTIKFFIHWFYSLFLKSISKGMTRTVARKYHCHHKHNDNVQYMHLYDFTTLQKT